MKKINILLLAALLLAGTGCKDYLEEEANGALLGAGALKSVQGLEAALTGTYKGLQNTWGTGFVHATAIAATMGGDDVTTHKASNKADFREFDQFAVPATNQRTQALYSGCYKAIQGANNVIANYKNTVAISDADKARVEAIAGEAYFLRAFSYFWLVRLYGSIPLITQAEFSDEMLTMTKSGPADVYKLIEADLLEAEKMMPNAKRNPGRPNKGTVKAYMAEVYLTQAGWPLKQTDKYALAAAKAKEVIDNRATYGFSLLPTYAEVFENDPGKNGTAEAVFQLSTFMGVGSTTNANYGWSAMPGEESGWDDFFAEINFFNNFPAGPRKDVTFRTNFKKADGSTVSWQQSQTQHPYYQKFYIKGEVKNWASSVPETLMRYAHVLTMYAEAKARTPQGPDQLAYNALNMIRERAGLAPIAFGSLSPQEFANAVVQERAWEFAAERTRWFDLVRLEMVEAANANKHPNDLAVIGSISKEDYTFPLPFSETSVNPNLGK
ncbi:RagB/SusD family nutrient uptake outer membrane protein [Adhaeribacter aquaticus]|uniref:RagB/SusD family nutrient uptake outer membrane protein n=1 Tax=Adhaeribacter aquaticus TaxID=299567 RepID=UPI0003FD130E|nr:RagB/SusD family nutrient uptake outer membrane protein [Adhaeribacter aquaticus]